MSAADGDTVTVLDSAQRQYPIRLAGIDAPEKGQAFGKASRKYLSDLVMRSEVLVKVRETDRYARLVGRIVV